LEDAVEGHHELGIAVMDQELDGRITVLKLGGSRKRAGKFDERN
jgi:hypothetical protein